MCRTLSTTGPKVALSPSTLGHLYSNNTRGTYVSLAEEVDSSFLFLQQIIYSLNISLIFHTNFEEKHYVIPDCESNAKVFIGSESNHLATHVTD